MVELGSGPPDMSPSVARRRSAAAVGEERDVGAAVVAEATKEPAPSTPLGREIVSSHPEQRPAVPGAKERDRNPRSPVGHMLERPVGLQLASRRARGVAPGPVLRVLPWVDDPAVDIGPGARDRNGPKPAVVMLGLWLAAASPDAEQRHQYVAVADRGGEDQHRPRRALGERRVEEVEEAVDHLPRLPSSPLGGSA